jgi:hypothetical protein
MPAGTRIIKAGILINCAAAFAGITFGPGYGLAVCASALLMMWALWEIL